MADPITNFLLNKGDGATEAQVVDAPAFSLTERRRRPGAVIIAPIATFVVSQLDKEALTPWNYVALALGLARRS